jgi:hypothetical protein
MTSSISRNIQGDTAAKLEKRFPVIQSQTRGALKLGKEGVYEYIPFP